MSVDTDGKAVLSAYPISHYAREYSICERKLRNDISDGKLHCFKFGRAIRISPEQFAQYLATLEA